MTESNDPNRKDAKDASPETGAEQSESPAESTPDTPESRAEESSSPAEEPEATETLQDSESVQPERTVAPKPPRRRIGLVVAVFLLLVVVIGLSGLGYWGYLQFQALADNQDQTEQRIATQGQQLEQLESQRQAQARQAEQAMQQLANTLRSEQEQLEQMVVETAQRLSRRQDLEADRWPLEEALALLRLAERRLQLDANADVSIRLLEAADQVLSGLTQAAVLPVRRQIARDRLALQGVETPDINGLYFRLSAISEQVRALTWTPESELMPRAMEEEPLSWQAFKDSLSSLVTITRLEVSHQAAPLLSDFALWQQQTLLLTEQAQLALLAANQPLFDAALTQLADRLQSMQASMPLPAIRAEVSQLTGANLNPTLPDIHASIEALEGYMTSLDQEEDVEGDSDG